MFEEILERLVLHYKSSYCIDTELSAFTKGCLDRKK